MFDSLTLRFAASVCLKLCILATILGLFPAIGWSQEYTITNLGTLGGTSSYANFVNDNGQVVGTANITGDTHGDAFLYAKGVMTDLAPGESTFGSTAVAINDQGHIVLNLYLDGNGDSESYLWNGINLMDLGAGGATSMNSSDMVVGYTLSLSYWVYANGQLDSSPGYQLPSPGVMAVATSVNDAGEIAGGCWDATPYDYGWGCVFGPNGAHNLQNLAGGQFPTPVINSSGTTCSYDINSNFSIWSNNGTQTVAIPFGYGAACAGLDDFGVAVGSYYFSNSENEKDAVVYDRLHGLRNLNKLIPQLSIKGHSLRIASAVAISDTGFIAANCVYSVLHGSSETHACLLTPNPVKILKDNILQLAKGDPDCIQCRTELDPLAEDLPDSLVGLSTAKQTKVSGIVNAIANDLLKLFNAKRINQDTETLLQHDCLRVQEALNRD